MVDLRVENYLNGRCERADGIPAGRRPAPSPLTAANGPSLDIVPIVPTWPYDVLHSALSAHCIHNWCGAVSPGAGVRRRRGPHRERRTSRHDLSGAGTGTACAAGAEPAPLVARGPATPDDVPDVRRGAAVRVRRTRRGVHQRAPRAAVRGVPAAHARTGGQPGRLRPARARRHDVVLLCPPALRDHAARAGVAMEEPTGPLPRGAHRAGGGHAARAGGFLGVPDGAAADDAGFRRHPRALPPVGLVGLGRERAGRHGRFDQRVRRNAVTARRLGPVVRMADRAQHGAPRAPGPGLGLSDLHHHRGDRHGEPLRRGRRRRERGDPRRGRRRPAHPASRRTRTPS